jgi:hypothetical protein
MEIEKSVKEMSGMELDKAVVRVKWEDADSGGGLGWPNFWCVVATGAGTIGVGATEPESWADASAKVIEAEGYNPIELFGKTGWMTWLHGKGGYATTATRALALESAKRDYVQRNTRPAAPAEPSVEQMWAAIKKEWPDAYAVCGYSQLWHVFSTRANKYVVLGAGDTQEDSLQSAYSRLPKAAVPAVIEEVETAEAGRSAQIFCGFCTAPDPYHERTCPYKGGCVALPPTSAATTFVGGFTVQSIEEDRKNHELINELADIKAPVLAKSERESASCDNAAEPWNARDDAGYAEGKVRCECGSYRDPDSECEYCSETGAKNEEMLAATGTLEGFPVEVRRDIDSRKIMMGTKAAAFFMIKRPGVPEPTVERVMPIETVPAQGDGELPAVEITERDIIYAASLAGIMTKKEGLQRYACRERQLAAARERISRYETEIVEIKHAAGVAFQITTCAICLKQKHTPVRNDSLGGYICGGCLERAYESARERIRELVSALEEIKVYSPKGTKRWSIADAALRAYAAAKGEANGNQQGNPEA